MLVFLNDQPNHAAMLKSLRCQHMQFCFCVPPPSRVIAIDDDLRLEDALCVKTSISEFRLSMGSDTP